MEATDKELIMLCKKNSRDGHELLFKKYEKYIYKICYFYASSKEDALDLLQDIFIKIFKSLDKFDEEKPLLPWIKKITVNTCINFSKKKITNEISLNQQNDDENNAIEKFLISSDNTENSFICSDTKRVLENSIRDLPDEMKMAIILRHIKGYSYKAISDIMSCPEGTVKTYLYRGRNLLKENLKIKGIWEV